MHAEMMAVDPPPPRTVRTRLTEDAKPIAVAVDWRTGHQLPPDPLYLHGTHREFRSDRPVCGLDQRQRAFALAG
jgi:hypothetical protein